ncbi:MAG TPA: MFS transporter [Acidimicrobiales bacterium]|jgi:EmrB/QacA subfamily drug resistance transporter|nr:MFS transporter [Acidimicrobiales bacterium]
MSESLLARSQSQRPRTERVPSWAVLAICCVAQFMVVLDVVIVNVALPQMRDSLGLSASGQQWVVNAYTLTFAGFLMLGGRAADLFGRRRVFLIGLSVFTVFSLLGGLAQSETWLLIARALQGIGGAILAPATLSILVTAYTDLEARRKALGAWSATAASGAAAGVLAGGILTSVLNWRWVLIVNVPIGVVLFVAAWVGLDRSRDEEDAKRSLDVVGATLVTIGLAVLVYGIVGTNTYPWGSARTISALAIGVVLLVAFFITEARFAKDPLIPLAIFKIRSVAVANAIAITVGTAVFGTYFFLSLFLQNVDGYSALRTGMAFSPTGISTLIAALIGTRLVQYLGVRRQLILGPSLAAIGLFWLSRVGADASYLAHVLGPVILIGFGLGLSFVPMTLAATSGVSPHEAGVSSGLINTTRQIGGALGLALMSSVAASAALSHGLGHVAAEDALVAGYRAAFAFAGGAMILAVLLALLLPVAANVGHHGVALEVEALVGEDALVAPSSSPALEPAPRAVSRSTRRKTHVGVDAHARRVVRRDGVSASSLDSLGKESR